jgi:hypothetical protein
VQKFGLKRESHVANFIAQKGSILSHFKQTFFVGASLCEGSFFVAEKLAL